MLRGAKWGVFAPDLGSVPVLASERFPAGREAARYLHGRHRALQNDLEAFNRQRPDHDS